jgi:(S)-2-hydroxyglutarate dehydrogenase
MRITIIGGGIVGLATALRLTQKLRDASITVLEKESSVGRHQSSHNSGVLHCGLYYMPGSLKARLAVTGIRQMIAFCQEHGIAHEVCGKLVVAATSDDVPRMNDLYERGQRNGLTGLRKLGCEEMREIEPHVGGVAAIHVPEEGIADYPSVCKTLVRCLAAAGGRVITNAGVHGLRRMGSQWIAQSSAGDFESDYIVTCAGLQSDRVCSMAGGKPELEIVPFRGEYYKLKPERQSLVRNLIYPVPDPRFPFLGVHFTRLIHGGVEAGPNAVLAFAREGYRKTDFSARDFIGTLTYPGFWHFFAKYPRVCWNELRRSFSKELFCRSLQTLVPEIQSEDLAPGGAGVRAQAISPQGEMIQDFRFVAGDHALHVLNAPSPAATASLAIGEEIANRLTAFL